MSGNRLFAMAAAAMAAGLAVAAGPRLDTETLDFGPLRPVRAGRRYNYEDPPPPPNPKADKRKANRVKAMQARKQRRREMSARGTKP